MGSPTPEMSAFVHRLLSLIPRLKTVDMIDDAKPELVTKKNRGLLGWCVRKDYVQMPVCLPTAPHELSHLVEMKSLPRILQDDFGLTMSNEGLAPASYYAAMAREARVRGIGSHLTGQETFGNRIWALDAPLNYGRFRNVQDVESWAHDIFSRARKDWDMSRIHDEVKLRADYIREYMETK